MKRMDKILTLFTKAWLCLAVGASAQRSFTSYPAPACGDPTISISSADNRNSVDIADNLLTRSEVEVRGTFWLAPDKTLGSFVVDLGCKVDLQTNVREVFTITEKSGPLLGSNQWAALRICTNQIGRPL